jgi:hypothetical protein
MAILDSNWILSLIGSNYPRISGWKKGFGLD